MNPDSFVKALYVICSHHGARMGRLTQLSEGWKFFAYPFYNDRVSIGMKAMLYTSIAGDHSRVAKMTWDHLTNCVVSGMGAPTSGLAAVGSGAVTVAGKFGGIRPAFGVNMGSVGAAQAIKTAKKGNDPSVRASQIAASIINSGHLRQYFVARIDRLGAPGPHLKYDIWLMSANEPNARTDYQETTISQGNRTNDNLRRYRVSMDGSVHHAGQNIGNLRHRRIF